jgi:hypothetical protein
MPGLQATGAGSFLQSEGLVRTKNKNGCPDFRATAVFEIKKQRDDFLSSFRNQSRQRSLQLPQEKPTVGTAGERRVYLHPPTWLEA